MKLLTQSMCMRGTVLLVLGTIALMLGTVLLGADNAQATENTALDNSIRQTPTVLAVSKAVPAVVSIIAERQARSSGFSITWDSSGRRTEQVQPKVEKAEVGSGVIIDGVKGLVVTNAHVIAGSSRIYVKLLDGKTYEADVFGTASEFDIAVLRVRTQDVLPAIVLGDSSTLVPGETVIAIGNPYGFSHTVTQGVVSALHRSLELADGGSITDLIQTDAAINPGNSGGALITLTGELIGINTIVHKRAAGIGFAIPVNKVQNVVAELLDQGHVSPLWLGIFGQDVDQNIAASLQLKQVKGVLVDSVYPNTPAAEAKFVAGDCIIAVNGTSIDDKEKYLSILRNLAGDKNVVVTVMREGKEQTIRVQTQELTIKRVHQLLQERWGVEVQLAKNGHIITKVLANSPAARLGLRRGDVFWKIGNYTVNSEAGLVQAFVRYRMANRITLQVQRDKDMYSLQFVL